MPHLAETFVLLLLLRGKELRRAKGAVLCVVLVFNAAEHEKYVLFVLHLLDKVLFVEERVLIIHRHYSFPVIPLADIWVRFNYRINRFIKAYLFFIIQ